MTTSLEKPVIYGRRINCLVGQFDRLVLWLAAPSIAREHVRFQLLRGPHDCHISGCSCGAVHSVQWGTNALKQRGNFCETHLRVLWDKCSSQVAAGQCFWIQDKPN